MAQIVTYGSMKARGVIRDVGRALDIPFGEVDKVAKLIPEALKMTIKKAMDEEPKLQEAADHDPRIAELLSVSKTLEGLARHTSTHAAGVVVSPGPMTQYLPTCRGSNEETLTQYDMKHTEMTGLIKFDFLGLKTLTVIDKALKHIKKDIGIDLDIDTIPMDDAKTFALLCSGDAQGVFQLESSGMRELLVKLAPEQFSDLIALVALYRPVLWIRHGGRLCRDQTSEKTGQLSAARDKTRPGRNLWSNRLPGTGYENSQYPGKLLSW